MKKIVGILLALCFVLSVTAASAAASEDRNNGAPDNHKKGPQADKDRFNNHDKKDRHDDGNKFNDNHGKKRHHHPAHWENKRVGHREWEINHGHWKTVYIIERIYVAGYWESD